MRQETRRLAPAIAFILIMVAATLATPEPARTAGVGSADGRGGPLPADGKDFRSAVWGHSRQKIRRQEASPPIHDEGPLLIFPAVVSDQDCRVIYLFHDDKLCIGFYQWSDTHEDLASYFDDARDRRGDLSAIWGTPPIDRWDWEDPMFKNEPSLHAEALGLGLVRYELGWMTDRSIIAMRMSGGNLKADILVMYADKTCFPSGQDIFGRFFADKIGLPTPYYR
jgi:hypothetical protein